MKTNCCLPFLFCLLFPILQFGQGLEDELDYSPSSSPLLLSLCTSFVPPPSSSSSSSSSTEQFPPLPLHSHHRPYPTSSHIGQPPNVSRSLALLSRSGQFAQLSLFAGANGTSEEEWSKWMEPINGQLRCSLRLEACPECLIELEWATPRTQFTDFQIQSLANCETQAIGGDDDLDLLLARSSDHRPCFGLNLVEERADRPLPPNAEFTSASAIFEPAYVFRRASIWNVPKAENREEEENVIGRFKSSGNNLLLMATLRHIGLDAQLGRWLHRLFPLRIRVLENKVTLLANKLPTTPTNGAIPSNNNSTGMVNEGFIQSARFPAAYPRGIRQNLTIVGVGGDLDAALRLQFDDFHLHYISELKIHDSDGRELFSSRREHRRPQPIETRTPSLSIFFSAREFTEPIGFRARFQLVNNASEKWTDRPSPKNCDDILDGFGGRIALKGQRHLLGEWVDCIWLVGRLTTGIPPAQQFDHLYLRVDQFHPRGEALRLEVREGGNSQGRLLLLLDGEQSPKQLVQKQPEEGFTLAQTPDATSPAAFYIRLRGRIESLSGLAILYAHFYRWPTALCPGGLDEFHCDNGKCIRASLRCDGYDHCGDSSDELCHLPADGGGLEDGDDKTQWPSSVLTIAFGVLTMFLLILLLVLFASRTARRHLVPSPLGNLYSLQSVRRRLQQQPQRRQQCCSQQREHSHREERTSSEAEGSQIHQRDERGIGGGHHQHSRHQNGTRGGDDRRNSSSIATQLDFAVLNNLLGTAAANIGPTIQTLGERRFFVLPADQAQISVIEAPPTYQDALKHPKVTPRGSRRLVHPSDGPIPSRCSDSQRNMAASAAYRNPVFRLSPTELLRMQMGRSENEGIGQREEEEQLEATTMRDEEEEEEEEEEFNVPQSSRTFRSESTLARSPRRGSGQSASAGDTEQQRLSELPSQGIGRFETIDLDVDDRRVKENNEDLDEEEATGHYGDGPSTSNEGPSSRQTIGQINLDMVEMIDEEMETPISSPKLRQENGQIPKKEDKPKNEGQIASEFSPQSARENAKEGSEKGKSQDRNPDRMLPMRIRRPAGSRRSTVPGE